MWGISSRFPLTVGLFVLLRVLLLPVSRVLPRVARMDSSEEASGLADLTHCGGPLPFDLQRAFLHACSWEVLLNLKVEKYLVSYLGRAQPLSCYFVLEYRSTGKNSSGSAWVPCRSCLSIKLNYVHVCVLSHVWLFAAPWTVARQAPLSVGILQARMLEWVAIPSSRGSCRPRD